MSEKIIIEINPADYSIWREFFTADLMGRIRAKKFKNKKEVLEEVDKLLPELKYEKDPLYGKGLPNDDHDD